MARIYSYVVRYDSGFAPNPFYGFCTLATCKPDIRKAADVGDWIIGCGSAARGVNRGGTMVYAMRVSEVMSFEAYNADARFQSKKPYRLGSRKQSCGDNIYFPGIGSQWQQRDSFHSNSDGTRHQEHVDIDTRVNRVLVSSDFVYFGGEGPLIPRSLVDSRGHWLCKAGVGRVCFNDKPSVDRAVDWVESLNVKGFQGPPFEWMSLRD